MSVQTRVKRAGGIETILKVMKSKIDDIFVCIHGCTMLTDISSTNSTIQNDLCEKGCISILLDSLKKQIDQEGICELYCLVIEYVLSSQYVYNKFFTHDIFNAVEECYKKHKTSIGIQRTLSVLMREKNENVELAVARSICTMETLPECDEYKDNIFYSSFCNVQQKGFRCFTCDKEKSKLYCETCWKRDHQEHECEVFFIPMKCATNRK